MFRKILYITILIGLLAHDAHAQRDYELVSQRNPWLRAYTAAGLITFADSNIVSGGAFLNYRNGETVSAADGESTLTWGAGVDSYYRLTPRIVTFGSVSYRNTNISDACGSALMTENKPFDIIEYTPGKKVMERIDLTGMIAWQMARRLSLGARVDYTTASYAKQKDLRHENTFMDLRTNLGLHYDAGSFMGALGFSYRRTTESVAFSTYGVKDIVYTSFIDYANGVGEYETYSGSDGFTDNTAQPLSSHCFGVTAALSLPRWMFVEFMYGHRDGLYGKESQYTFKHMDFNSDITALHARLTFSGENTLHWVDGSINTENLVSYRTNHLEETVNGVKYYTYYESTKAANKVMSSVNIGYTAYLSPLNHDLYRWTLRAGADIYRIKQTGYLYPVMETTDITSWRPYLSVGRNILLGDKRIMAELGASHVTEAMPVPLMAVKGMHGSVKAGYEFPIRRTPLRANVMLGADISKSTSLSLSIGVMM